VFELANVLERRITGRKDGVYVDERRITWQIGSADAFHDTHEWQPEGGYSSAPRSIKSDPGASFVKAGLRFDELGDGKHSNPWRKIPYYLRY